MPVDDEITNTSGNRPFQEVLSASLTRRAALSGGVASAAALFLSPSPVAAMSSFAQTAPAPGSLLGFTPAPNPGGPDPTISPEYDYYVIIPWGSPIKPGGPDIAGGRPQSAAEAEAQIGAGHDGMAFFARYRWNNQIGVLCINHEFGRNNTVLGHEEGGAQSLEEVRISQATHGLSIVELDSRNSANEFRVVDRGLNRRITPNTPVEISGPAADHPLLQTASGSIPKGTVNNCANGRTPWGTYLTCEENFNGYFGSSAEGFETEERDRYGFSAEGFGYNWYQFDSRWDLSSEADKNEEHRFGWIVEVSPWHIERPTVKRTALGRFKHEGIALTIGRGGRAVGYMGDDQRFDYVYKFVSAGDWRTMRRQGISPLDHGQLYVARFNDDGSGDWLEITMDNPVIAERFADEGEMLIYTRIAADLLGATPMDRPEWTTVAPNGDVFVALTNNTQREVADAANPEAPNSDGHIIKIADSDDHVGTTFDWDIFLMASETRGTDYEFTDPDGLYCDPDGRLFIQTDGGQPNGNNQMLVADTTTGEIRRMFAGVEGDEITGITFTQDRRTMFINTQHPGNGDPMATNFPIPGSGGDAVPRDATFVITRKDGGVIGS